MNGIERIKLIGELVRLNKTVPGASPLERIKGIAKIIAVVKQLGGAVNAGGAKNENLPDWLKQLSSMNEAQFLEFAGKFEERNRRVKIVALAIDAINEGDALAMSTLLDILKKFGYDAFCYGRGANDELPRVAWKFEGGKWKRWTWDESVGGYFTDTMENDSGTLYSVVSAIGLGFARKGTGGVEEPLPDDEGIETEGEEVKSDDDLVRVWNKPGRSNADIESCCEYLKKAHPTFRFEHKIGTDNSVILQWTGRDDEEAWLLCEQPGEGEDGKAWEREYSTKAVSWYVGAKTGQRAVNPVDIPRIKGIPTAKDFVSGEKSGAAPEETAIKSDEELVRLWNEHTLTATEANEYLQKNYPFFVAIPSSGDAVAFKFDHGAKWWCWGEDGASGGIRAASEVIDAFCKTKSRGGEIRKIEHSGRPSEEDFSHNEKLVIKTDADLINAWEAASEDASERRRVAKVGANYLWKTYGQTFRIMGRKLTKIYQAGGGDYWTRWTHDDYSMGPAQSTKELVEPIDVVSEFVAAKLQGNTYSIRGIESIRDYPTAFDFKGGNAVAVQTEGRVETVEEFCQRYERNFKDIKNPENEARKALFAYLEKEFGDGGFHGQLDIRENGRSRPWSASWRPVNGEWYRAVQGHDEMEGALSRLDPSGTLVLSDFVRFANNGSLCSDPKLTEEDKAQVLADDAAREDFETLQSIIDGVHPDMKSPRLYDTLAAIDERQKDRPGAYPEMLERALDEWQSVVLDMTSKIIA